MSLECSDGKSWHDNRIYTLALQSGRVGGNVLTIIRRTWMWRLQRIVTQTIDDEKEKEGGLSISVRPTKGQKKRRPFASPTKSNGVLIDKVQHIFGESAQLNDELDLFRKPFYVEGEKNIVKRGSERKRKSFLLPSSMKRGCFGTKCSLLRLSMASITHHGKIAELHVIWQRHESFLLSE